MGIRRMLSSIVLLVLLYNSEAFASWSGPNVTVQGSWGASDGQFGLHKAETKDEIPDSIVILSDGKILVDDGVNGVIKIFDVNGQFLKALEIWALGFWGLDSDQVVSGKLDATGKTRIGVYSLSKGQWLWVDNNRDIGYLSEELVYVSDAKDIYIWNNSNKGYRYSSTGGLIETFTTKPLVFGKEEKYQKLNDGNYLTGIKFDDFTYKCKTPTGLNSFTRDKLGYLYGIARVGEQKELHTRIYKITKCGNVIATLDFPADKRHGVEFTDQLPTTSIEVVDEEYGPPVVTPNGDVYTWKRTPDNYSILKWTWQDDPNMPTGPDVPTGLVVMPSAAGLYLTWKASPQDPGCVSGYEIARATTSGGVYTSLATVDKGILKYNDTTATAGTTYYYKVRAVSGTDYSPYTSEVSGTK